MKNLISFLIAVLISLSVPAQGPPSKQGPNPNAKKIAKANEKEMRRFNKKKLHLKKVAPSHRDAGTKERSKPEKKEQNANTVNPGEQ